MTDIAITFWIKRMVLPGLRGGEIVRYQPVMRVHEPNAEREDNVGRSRDTVTEAVGDLLECLQPPREEWDT